jgi:ankyrin repeat protein
MERAQAKDEGGFAHPVRILSRALSALLNRCDIIVVVCIPTQSVCSLRQCNTRETPSRCADSLTAFVAAMPKPEPTLVDTAFIIALAGYHDEAAKCMRLCNETYTDERLLEPLVHAHFGRHRTTLLSEAARRGAAERVALLLRCGAPINAVNAYGSGALSYACANGHDSVASMLLDKGANVNGRDNMRPSVLPVHPKGGHSPLHGAVVEGHEATARLLLDRGAFVDVRNGEDDTPLLSLCRWEEENEWFSFCAPELVRLQSVLQLLIDRGADVNARGSSGDTPLHILAGRGFYSLPGLLIQNGADVNARNREGETPLHLAVSKGFESLARLLIQNGADVNGQDENGPSPLIYARTEAVEQLLRDAGAV